MHIKAKLDYAVRAVIVIASADEGQPTRSGSIAEAQEIPMSFLGNILEDLRKAGLIKSRRGGRHGGYFLARPADEITLADVIRAVEGRLTSVRGERVEELSYPGVTEPLQRVWIAMGASVEAIAERVTLADLATGRLPDDVAAPADAPDV